MGGITSLSKYKCQKKTLLLVFFAHLLLFSNVSQGSPSPGFFLRLILHVCFPLILTSLQSRVGLAFTTSPWFHHYHFLIILANYIKVHSRQTLVCLLFCIFFYPLVYNCQQGIRKIPPCLQSFWKMFKNIGLESNKVRHIGIWKIQIMYCYDLWIGKEWIGIWKTHTVC